MEETEALIKEPRKLGKNEIDMTSGPLVSKMLKFAIPLVLSGLLQLLFNAADLVVVGRFAGSASLAAVGAAASPVNMVVCLLIGLSTGVNVVVARAVGAGREKDIHEAIHTAILVAMIGGLILVLVGLAVSEPLLRFTKTPEEVLPLAKTYQDILFIGIPIMAVYNFGSAIFRARGDTKRPLIFLSVAGALNVALNLVFVIVFHLAVVGVALATVLSQVVSTTMILITLSREKGPFKLELKKLRIHKSKLIPILRMGIPAGIQGMMFSVSNLVVQSFINAFGKTVMAASSAASSLEGFTFIVIDSFAQTSVSFTSQNMGAGKFDRIKKVFRMSVLLGCGIGEVFGLVTYFFGEPLLGIYSTDPAVIEQGMIRLFWMCLPYAVCAFMNIVPGSVRGMGYSIFPTVATMVGACVLRIVWLETVCTLPQCSGIEWVWAAYLVTWAITGVAHYVFYRIVYKKVAGQAENK